MRSSGKRVFSIILASAMMLSMAACGSNVDNEEIRNDFEENPTHTLDNNKYTPEWETDEME